MRARIVPVKLDAEGLKEIDQAARLLAQGALVAFPTETVYGIGCNADDPQAVERLRAIKRRPPGKPFTIHIGRREDVARHVEHVPPFAERLMRRYWPGPLTIVFAGNQAARGGHSPSRPSQAAPVAQGPVQSPGIVAVTDGVGLRMPSNPIALELLQRTPVPVIAPSANRSGEPPARSARDVADALGDELDLILDGGPATLQEPSTVVRVTDDAWEILRHGSVTDAMIRRTLGTTIVFVCTANMCRSPMAEVLCKKMLAERLGCPPGELSARGYEILSAGTGAPSDCRASAQAVAAMRQQGLDLSGHLSQPLTPGLLEDADVVFVMVQHHAATIAELFPEASAKVRLLDPAGGDIGDPVGASEDVFRECAAAIQRYLREVIATL
jgi:protein-tyrosine phosphatase